MFSTVMERLKKIEKPGTDYRIDKVDVTIQFDSINHDLKR
jgi:hypothetical protein